MVPSGKGTEGLFQRARAAVAPVLVWTSGAPVLEAAVAEDVSARLAAGKFAWTASGRLAFLTTLVAKADAVVV